MLARPRASPVNRVHPARTGAGGRARPSVQSSTTLPGRRRPRIRPGRDGRDGLYAFLLALGIVFLAELGDKSQLLALTLAARRSAAQVLLGVALAALVLQGLSAGLGAALATAVPRSAVMLVTGLTFLVAAGLTLRRSDDPGPITPARAGSTVLLAFGGLLVAELGDKTMLATAALATREDPVMIWLGGTAGFVAADALAVLVGITLFRRLPVRAVRLTTAGLFAVLGLALLAGLL
jgi:putative Ca2+/H+ antiporter (TMEM165/GDT1 family)